jgi:hypothetical protein
MKTGRIFGYEYGYYYYRDGYGYYMNNNYQILIGYVITNTRISWIGYGYPTVRYPVATGCSPFTRLGFLRDARLRAACWPTAQVASVELPWPIRPLRIT